MIVSPVSLPIQPVIELTATATQAQVLTYGRTRLEVTRGAARLVLTTPTARGDASTNAGPAVIAASVTLTGTAQTGADANAASQAKTEPASKPQAPASKTPADADRRSFWARVFNLPPLRTRVEKVLNDEWKFTDVRPRHIEFLLSDEGEDARYFFLQSGNARQFHRLVKEFGCGFETRSGRVVDETFDTLNEYGPELIQQYSILMENRETIKRYWGGVFRDGRISTQALIRISNSMWFGPFEAPRLRLSAHFLHTRFQVPEHVIGPMLASVGDSLWLRAVLARRSAPQEFKAILNKIAAPDNENSGNAFAPALQLLVIGEEHKLPVKTLTTFLDDLKLRPKDFGPFSAIEYNLAAYRLAEEIKCPTFAQYLRTLLDEYGQDINQESARLLLLSYREFKDNDEALRSLLSQDYSETRAFLKSVGTVSSSVWNLQRVAVLARTLTPAKRAKIAALARELATELTVADVMFLSDIADNEEECKLLLDRQALIAGVKDVKIDRIVERSHNDLVKELEREIDSANSSGLYRTVRRLRNMLSEEKLAYTERVDPSKLTNIQLSRLLIFHRSLDMPGFLDTVGWNVSLDLQNDRSELGGYLGYDKDMAMVTMVAGQPGNNRQYRPVNLDRAAASLALFHNHAFKDSFFKEYFTFFNRILPIFPANRVKNTFAGPSGWLGAEKGDITAAAESELPSFIITKIGNPTNPDGSKDRKNLLVNFDWVVVDKSTGEALRSDRGIFTVPFFGDEQLGKLKWPSKKEQKRRDRAQREKCPPGIKQAAEIR